MQLPSRNKDGLLNRFLEYVQINTEADPLSSTIPSSERQKNLSRLLEKQCKEMGLTDVLLTDHGYVYATIPGNTSKAVPTICFCSHVDTAPDCSGNGVKPLVHSNYQGQDIILPDDPSQVLNPTSQPELRNHYGDDIITASGLTLLGADDKSGVAIIMETAQYLLQNPDILHGDVRILFTTDEEVGRGVDHVEMDLLNADFGYTLDGGSAGSFEDETFSADALTLNIRGVSAHPGMAKGVMEHASKIAADILSTLPKDRLTPETTAHREGFIHPTKITGGLESARIEFILRDFETERLTEYKALIESTAQHVLKNYPGSSYDLNQTEQYRNMKEVLKNHPVVSAYAEEAIRRSGLSVSKEPIRGGTDGSRLSFMGLPCPNIFTGMQSIHSRQEWIALQDMVKSMTTLIHLVQIWEEKS